MVYASLGVVVHTHNDLLDMLVIGGVLGLTVLGLIFTGIVAQIRAARPASPEFAVGVAILLVLGCQSFFTGQLFLPDVMSFYLLSITAVLACAREPGTERLGSGTKTNDVAAKRLRTQSLGPISSGEKPSMRVLVTTPLLAKAGGVAQYLRVVRPHLHGDVEYLTVGARSDHESALEALTRLLKDCGRFARALMRGRHEIVHLNPSLGSKALIRDGLLLLIAKIFRKTVLVFTHGWDEKCEHLIEKHFRTLFRFVFGQADAFIVLGSQFKERLRVAGYEKTVFVHGAPVDDQLLVEARRHPIRMRPGEEYRRFNILYLARIEKLKGIYDALDAYASLKAEHPFVSLTIAGDGCELRGAKRYATSQNLADVFFLGHLEAAEVRILSFGGCIPVSLLHGRTANLGTGGDGLRFACCDLCRRGTGRFF